MVQSRKSFGNKCRAFSVGASREKKATGEKSMLAERSHSIWRGGVVSHLNHEPSRDRSRLLNGPTATVSTVPRTKR